MADTESEATSPTPAQEYGNTRSLKLLALPLLQ